MDPVLIVEDDPLTAELLQVILEGKGIACRCTALCSEAIGWMGQHPYSLVLLDYTLADGPGWPVLDAARTLEKGPPVIMLTGRDDTWLAQQAVDRGALEFWMKHEIDWQEVPGRVREAVERSRTRAPDNIVSNGQGQAEQELLVRNRLIMFQADVFSALSQHTELATMLKACLEAIVMHLNVTLARVWTLDAARGVLELQASAGEHTPVPDVYDVIPLGRYRVGRIAQQAQPDFSNDMASNPDGSDPEWTRENGIVGFAGYPLMVEGRVEGVLALVSQTVLNFPLPSVLETVARGLAQALARLRSQTALRKSEAMLARVVEGSNDGFFDCHVPTGRVHYSPRFSELLGCELEPVLASWDRLVHPEDFPRLAQQREACLSGRAQSFGLELRMLQVATGKWRWFLARGKVASWLGPSQAEWMTGTVKDIDQRKKATESLARSNQELRKLTAALEQSPVGVIMTDVQGTIQYVNPRFVEMSGYDLADVLGRKPSLFKSGVHSNEFYRDLWETVLAGRVFRGEMCNRRKDGQLYWAQDLIAPVRSAEGELVHFIGFQEEITGRKEMERQLADSEEKFKEIFQAMEDGYLSQSLDGRLLLINPAGARLLGYESESDLTARGWSPAEQDWSLDLEPILSGESRTSDRSTVRRPDGTVRIFECNSWARRGPDGQPRSVETMFRDITERVQAEEQQQARQAAEEANRLKSQFLAHMSHEIRTPLNGILGMAHLCLGGELSDRHRHYLETILRSGQNLLAIVNDILDFSKVEAGRLELEQVEFRLDDVLDNLVSVLAGRAAEKGLELQLQVDPEIPAYWIGDPLRLGQVLINLVSNAIKFTDAGRVEVEVTAEQASGLRFAISDTGVGISAEALSGLFRPFAQADSSTTRQYGGTGLGLAICQRLVHLMEGSIQAQSVPGSGSTFSFTARLEPSEGPRSSRPDLSGLRAIILEGDPDAREGLRSALRRLGLRTSEQATAESCLAEIERARKPFDFVFVSLHLPGRLSALETVRRLRVESDTSQIVLMARHGDEGVAEQAVLAGVHALLFKPFTRSHLLDTIMTLKGCPDPSRPRHEPSSAETLAAIQGARILLVEDNPINQEIACELLRSAGLEVDVVGDGRQAVDRVVEAGLPSPWQVVLMDLQMPEMDGYTAAATIRKDPRFARLPIVAMTAHVLPEERERCYTAGMDDYLSKPIDPVELLATLGRWIAAPALPEPPASEFPALEGVDVTAGLARVAGNAGLYRSLLLDLVRQRQETCAGLRAASKDPELARRLAHSLVGSAANLGLGSVAEAAREIESLARADRLAELSGPLERLEQRLEQLEGALRDALEGWSPDKPPAREGQTVESALARLESLLQDSDGASLEACEELRGLVSDDRFDRLAELVSGFQFSEALEELRSLQQVPTVGC